MAGHANYFADLWGLPRRLIRALCCVSRRRLPPLETYMQWGWSWAATLIHLDCGPCLGELWRDIRKRGFGYRGGACWRETAKAWKKQLLLICKIPPRWIAVGWRARRLAAYMYTSALGILHRNSSAVAPAMVLSNFCPIKAFIVG